MSITDQIQQSDLRLLAAAENGNLASLKGALHGAASFDATDSKGRNVLHLAAAGGHTHILEYLSSLENAPLLDWEARDHDGNTPLLTAFEFARAGAVRFLIGHGSKTDVKDNKGNGILRKAADQRNPFGKEMLQLALEQDDALDNTCNENGHGALHLMVEKQNIEGLQLALLSGANPRLRGDHVMLTPLQLAEADNLAAEEMVLKTFEELPIPPESYSGLTTEKLLQENSAGKRLIDNPRIWRHMEEVLQVLEEKGEPMPKKADLLSGGVMGYNPIALARLNNRYDLALGMMESHGEAIETADFWTPDHEGINQFGRVAIELGLVENMFTAERWVGRSPHQLKDTYHQMPQEMKESVTNWHVLISEVSREHRLEQRMEQGGASR